MTREVKKMMRMMNSERHKQLLIDKNVIFHIGSGYYFVVRDLTEFGLLTTNLSKEYETVDMALEEYIIMRRNFNKKFREFRHRIMLLDIVATRPVFYERKNKFSYRIRTKSERGKTTCFNYGGFNTRDEAKNHWLNNRINILKRIMGEDYE